MMNKLIACLLLLLPFTLPAQNRKLVWSDEFNYTGQPDPAKWRYEEGFVRHRESQYYTKNRYENAHADGNNLVITAIKEEPLRLIKGGPSFVTSNSGGEFTSACLNTEDIFEFTNGRVEVRAKLPHGRGVWPAIWTLGNNLHWGKHDSSWVYSEIDIMEFVGHDPNNVYANIHPGYEGGSRGGKITVEKPWEDFHIYAIEWQKDRIDFYFDDSLYFSYNKKDVPPGKWAYDTPQYLLINLAIGGAWGGEQGIDYTAFPAQFIIDYVRIYDCTVHTQQQQQQAAAGGLRLLDWQPKSQLVVKTTAVPKPKFPVIDMHNHLGALQNTQQYLQEMDKAGVIKCVSLDGLSANDQYKEHLKASQKVSKDRFLVFFRPDFSKIDESDFGRKEAARLEAAVKEEVRGVKIAKELGLVYKDKSGKLVAVDDPRIDPIWAKCGELGIPVLIHVSDPNAFFTPVDRYNERYDELGAHPDWSFYGPQFPSKATILAQRNRVIEKHPNTIFIGAHVANLSEDLGSVAALLDKYPNLYVEIGARISELGRQPYSCRDFMIKYQDRILFGTDTPCDSKAYEVYYRFLETKDEYIDPAPSHHLQGRWMIYGLYLPDAVLEKIYNRNAQKILDKRTVKS